MEDKTIELEETLALVAFLRQRCVALRTELEKERAKNAQLVEKE